MVLGINDLLTIAGAAAATLLALQFLIKPLLKARPVSDAVYPLVINLSGVVLSALFVLLGLYATKAGLTEATIGQGVLTTLLAAVTATGAYEAQSNLKMAVGITPTTKEVPVVHEDKAVL